MRDKIDEESKILLSALDLRILVESTKRIWPKRYKVYRTKLRKKIIIKYYNESNSN